MSRRGEHCGKLVMELTRSKMRKKETKKDEESIGYGDEGKKVSGRCIYGNGAPGQTRFSLILELQ